MRSLTDPPPSAAAARFDPGFGQRFVVTVDTEEEFDWDRPLTREGHGTRHVANLTRFQQFCEDEGIHPVYLIDWPIAQSPLAAEILGPAIQAGRASIGAQLHAWVNPPFEEEVNQRNSFPGNLPPELESAKFAQLREAIERRFGHAPIAYRAGRYGIGPATAAMLGGAGIAIDSSVRANFDYTAAGGPDFRGHPLHPYWLDEAKTLLELPLTTVFWGMLRRQGHLVYPALWRAPRLRGLLSRLRLLERIPLTPEGISVNEAIRGIDVALDDGLPLLVFSFHSPSLQAGHTPYVRSASDLARFYDWWRRILAYLEQRQVRAADPRQIMQVLRR